jgi:hypothetical protein
MAPYVASFVSVHASSSSETRKPQLSFKVCSGAPDTPGIRGDERMMRAGYVVASSSKEVIGSGVLEVASSAEYHAAAGDSQRTDILRREFPLWLTQSKDACEAARKVLLSYTEELGIELQGCSTNGLVEPSALQSTPGRYKASK